MAGHHIRRGPVGEQMHRHRPVGKYVGSDTGSGHRVSADDPGAMTDPFMRNESAERAVQNALIAFCP
ncbi:hypothetical protein MELE44368_24965 [Mycolicibacterium elephantis DSM 44368]|uniref:Uncharacterized protein n=1 Tax=Mycolicibacterium elephantis DSM 44368 TaxID=1335622 RepID=A0A439DQ26_9MYCO|nr:hypothetical protein MELE44368_24965 [Mycolicibacterium elephantis DSM 44368]